ncbi:fimbria/pilus periplasmic chaperone [Klebsiella aerogenes]|uniref:fimbria/pilus periplasmic chaperone n=1 Tax=Klebsiella aerogenes TaxID=548 RepID=UPI003D31342C
MRNTLYFKKIIYNFILLLTTSFLIISFSSHARGVALGATRVIYPQLAKQTSININNSSPDSRFLIQSWVEDKNSKKSNDFIVTPPLFVSKAKSENSLRIMYVGKPLPNDRESIFWLNAKAIPELDTENITNKNVLQLAIVSRIKLFVRPSNLNMSAADAKDKIKFKYHGDILDIKNPTPYYMTLVRLTLGGKLLPNSMIPPFHTSTLKVPTGLDKTITFQTINDYGAETPVQKGVEE